MLIDTFSVSNSYPTDRGSSFTINATPPLSQLRDTEIPKRIPTKEINDTDYNNIEQDTTDDEDLSTHSAAKTRPCLKESMSLMNSEAGLSLQKHNTIDNFKSSVISNMNQVSKRNDKRTRLHFPDDNFEIEAKKRKSSVILKPILV